MCAALSRFPSFLLSVINKKINHFVLRAQVLKDAATLSQTKGVLDGGSAVHVVSRPPEAERAGSSMFFCSVNQLGAAACALPPSQGCVSK